MIPNLMEVYLRQQFPERTWKNRLIREDGMCFMEFGPMDVERLGLLGIEVDHLGPKLVACIWDEQSKLEIGGYLVVDNLSMGRPSIGGIRVQPELSPSQIHNIARAMTLKNAAANLPYGGGNAGLIASTRMPPELRDEAVRRFARLLYRYRDIFLPGPDVGTSDADMRLIAIDNGLDLALSKPVEMGGNQGDQFGAGGGGLAIALEALLVEMPRLRVLPQFANLTLPDPDNITVMLQGFGAVGAQAARILCERVHGCKVVGISDTSGYLYNPYGLPVKGLFKLWQEHRLVTRLYYESELSFTTYALGKTKYSSAPEDMLRENAFCVIPAAPVAVYLDTDPAARPCITTDEMGRWQVIIEGANTYSPEPARRASRARMEREVYRRRGILIATDFLVNSGGVIFAAQEHLIPTPNQLQIPEDHLGNSQAVDDWLEQHAEDLAALAEKRRIAAEKARDEVIRHNMRELVDLLLKDADTLPCEAAEQISIQRITSREMVRKASDVMERIVTIPISGTVQEAARLLVETGCPVLAVLNEQGEIVGVITNWDITQAASRGPIESASLERVMTRQVISCNTNDSIIDIVRKLEYYEISAMPVVKDKKVKGLVSADTLAHRSLYRLLQTQGG
ncbi:MAG: CBS domain-containing protein [Anaerolineales bacterium]|nr:CBS domain-containing protein [Anaerolineales bacterium]